MKCTKTNGESHVITLDCVEFFSGDNTLLRMYLSNPQEFVVWGDHDELGNRSWIALTEDNVLALTRHFYWLEQDENMPRGG